MTKNKDNGPTLPDKACSPNLLFLVYYIDILAKTTNSGQFFSIAYLYGIAKKMVKSKVRKTMEIILAGCENRKGQRTIQWILVELYCCSLMLIIMIEIFSKQKTKTFIDFMELWE